MKAVTFDYAAFRRDVRKRIAEEGNGAMHRMNTRCGISAKAVRRIVHGQRVRDIETILSVLAYCGFPLARYVKRSPELPPRGVDWKLFRECAEFLSGGDPAELARQAQIDPATAKTVLRFGSCRPNVFLKLCHAMHVPADKFGKGWQHEWRLSATGRQRVAAVLS